MPRVELHCHSHFSDGTLPPAELVARALKSGVTLLVLTDHDSVSGAADLAAAPAGGALERLTGIEINCAGEAADRVHVLGYGLRPDAPGFGARLAEFRERRTVRARLMVEKLKALGLPVEYEDVRATAHETVGRPHLADALRRRGLVKSRQEAFDRFLAHGKPAYVPPMGPSPEEAIGLIRDAGGFACLAHPQTAGKEPELEALRRLGLEAIEVRYGAHTPSQVRMYGDYAAAKGLLALGGSDYHGTGTGRDARLGVDYDDAELAAFKERLARCS